ncbi:MAG: transglycosylase family protein [Actinomycetota bacterium]
MPIGVLTAMTRSRSLRRTVARVGTCLGLIATIGLLAPFSAGAEEEPGPTVETAQAALEEAEAVESELETDLEQLLAERREVEAALAERDDRRERAAEDLRRARTGAQSLAVLAYMTVDAGAAGLFDDSAADALYQETLVRDGADARRQAAAYYQDLQSQADGAVTETVGRLDELDRRIEEIRADRDLAADEIRAAATDLESARAAAEAEERAREEAAELAALPASTPVPTDPGGPWVPIGSIPGGPSAAQWAQLRNCESSGNYQAVSPGGKYRGAYQFDLPTWGTVGGSGDPIAASPAEQDHRAQLLWQSRGHAPWPVCGRYLR